MKIVIILWHFSNYYQK